MLFLFVWGCFVLYVLLFYLLLLFACLLDRCIKCLLLLCFKIFPIVICCLLEAQHELNPAFCFCSCFVVCFCCCLVVVVCLVCFVCWLVGWFGGWVFLGGLFGMVGCFWWGGGEMVLFKQLFSFSLFIFFFSFFFFFISFFLFSSFISSLVREFVHGVIGRRIDPSW